MKHTPTRHSRCVHRSLILAVVLLTTSAARAGLVKQDFFLPIPEDQLRLAFTTIHAGGGNTMDSVFSVVITTPGTVLYFDQWENGYDADMAASANVWSTANPGGTQIWGDGNDANGIPPGFVHDTTFSAGTVVTLRNLVTLPRNPAQILFDGRDHLGATKAIIMTRACWASNIGPVQGCAVEVPGVNDHGTRYICPVGEDVLSNGKFQYVGLYVMADFDGTTVTVDRDGPGAIAPVVMVLNKGGTYQVNGGIKKGAYVSSSLPVQAYMSTGDKTATYETRSYTLRPVARWSNRYLTPVGTANNGNPAVVFLFNTNPAPLTVRYTSRAASGTLTVPANNGVLEFQVPRNAGTLFTSTNGSPFSAICAAGADPASDQAFDWGFSLLPYDGLTTEAVVGWGAGSATLAVNGSPIWVTVPTATIVYVDYHADHAGPLTDPVGHKYDVAYTLATLESRTIYEPGNDQTGMRLYTLDDTVLSATWGQDPAVAGPGSPYLDMGTAVLPFPIRKVKKTGRIAVDNPPTGLSTNDVVEYSVTYQNHGVLPALSILVLDDLPTNKLQYIAHSTSNLFGAVPDDTVGTPFPMDAPGYTISVIEAEGSNVFTFRCLVIASGQVINNASADGTIVSNDLPPLVINPCIAKFTDSLGNPLSVYTVGAMIWLNLDDNAANTSPLTIQYVSLVIRNINTGDAETLVVRETGVNTGLFFPTNGMPTSVSGGGSYNGILQGNPGDTISITYTNLDNQACSATAYFAIPPVTNAQTKVLYLSDQSNGMDRVDPVATSDNTTYLRSVGVGGAATSRITFTQYPPFKLEFTIPAGSVISITSFVNQVSAAWPQPTNLPIAATLSAGGATLFTMSTARYSIVGGFTNMVWTGVLPADITIPSNQSLLLSFTNSTAGSFSMLCDSITYPSRLMMPTRSVIAITDISVYNAAYPTGVVVVSSTTGSVRYVRVTVTDPFGAYDINSLDLSIDGPGSADITVTNISAVVTNASSKTFQYQWPTSSTAGTYVISATAREGTEGITARAVTNHLLTVNLAVRAAASAEFTATLNGILTTIYPTNSTVFLRASDTDANTNPTTIQTNVATVVDAASGDSETIILVETGTNSGVFAGFLTASTLAGQFPNDGTLFAPQGSLVTATYVDPGDPTDVAVAFATIASIPIPLKTLYLSDQSNGMDRVDPVATSDGTTYLRSVGVGGAATSRITFTQYPPFKLEFTIPAGSVISITSFVNQVSAAWPQPTNLPIAATLSAGGSTLFAMNTARYSIVGGFTNMVWTGVLPADITIPSNQSLLLSFTNSTAGALVNNLIGRWVSGETNLADISGFTPAGTHNGKAVGSNAAALAWSSDVPPGFTGKSLDLSASNVAVLITNTALTDANYQTTFDEGISNRFTVAFWFKGTLPASPQVWVSKCGIDPHGWQMRSSTPNAQFTMRGAGMYEIPPGQPNLYSANTVTNSTWYHFAAVFNGTASFRQVYVDGVFQGQATGIPYSVTIGNLSHLMLGANQVNGTNGLIDNFWPGKLYDVRIYNSALSTAAVSALIVPPPITNVPSFSMLCDSITFPSRLMMPTTNVISIASLGMYNSDDVQIMGSAVNGETLYIRTMVADPFGAYDISSLDLSIDGPGVAGDVTVTLFNASVISSNAWSKTYEYRWVTPLGTGDYTVLATAREGTEGIVAQASLVQELTWDSVFTPSDTEFTTGANGAHTLSYQTNETLFVRVRDYNRNTNASTAQTVLMIVTNDTNGDVENVLLAETGIDTGIFTGGVPARVSSGAGITNGVLLAPSGSTLIAFYHDVTSPDQPDSSSDTAAILLPGPGLFLTKSVADPVSGQTTAGNTIQFAIRVINTGGTTQNTVSVVDTFPTNKLAYTDALPAPDSTESGTATWANIGPLLPGQYEDIAIYYTASATATNRAIATAGSLSSTGLAAITVVAPAITVTKTPLTAGPLSIGSTNQFRIVVLNSGSTRISSLPLQDIGDSYQFLSATVPPDGIGSGLLLWNNVISGPFLNVGAAFTNTLTMRAVKVGNPAFNEAKTTLASDEFGNPLPDTSSVTGIVVLAASIRGTVYNDYDTNGVFSTGDVALVGVTITLFTDPFGNGTGSNGVIASGPFFTMADGSYQFLDLVTGSYIIVETDPVGYVSSSPNRLAVNATNFAAFSNRDFFDYPPPPSTFSILGGTVWNDFNKNSLIDDGATAVLANVQIDLVQDDNSNGVVDVSETAIQNVWTGTNGAFQFPAVSLGRWIIRENDPAGFISTSSNLLPVTTTAGSLQTNFFFLDCYITPFIDITNVNMTVAYAISTFPVAGTNNPTVVGDMWVTNATLGGPALFFASAPGWTAQPLNLATGANVIIVYGANALGILTNDTITIFRLGNVPFVAITSPPNNYRVPFRTTSQAIAGTSSNLVGSMWYSTLWASGSDNGSFPATNAWSQSIVLPTKGTYSFTIVGTNDTGTAVSNSVNLIRQKNRLLWFAQ